jgi:hypothetical protein
VAAGTAEVSVFESVSVALDIVVIFALTSHGGEMKAAREV